MRLPVGIHSQKNKIIGLSGKHNSNLPVIKAETVISNGAVVERQLRGGVWGRLGGLAENGMSFPKTDHPGNKVKQLSVKDWFGPVKPGNVIILAVGVVVAHLGVPKFIAGWKHNSATAA